MTEHVPRLLLASPDQATAHGLAMLLRNEGPFEVTVVADEEDEIVDSTADERPDLLLIGPRYPALDLDSFADRFQASFPNVPLVVLTADSGHGQLEEAVSARASGFLSVESEPGDFVDQIRMLLRGNLVVAAPEASDLSEIGQIMGEDPLTHADTPGIRELSKRERQVLLQIAQGATNQEIADLLGIALSTVKVHTRNIFKKLGLKNRHHAAAFAVEHRVKSDAMRPAN